MKIDCQKLDIAIANERLMFKEVSSKAGISYECLTKIRNGTRNPKPSTVGKIAKALNVDVRDIIQEEGE